MALELVVLLAVSSVAIVALELDQGLVSSSDLALVSLSELELVSSSVSSWALAFALEPVSSSDSELASSSDLA